MAGFVIWALVGVLIIVLGIRAFFAKKPVGFWANAETGKVNDVKGYNRATGTLFTVYGIVFILLGLPLLAEQKMPLMLLTAFGVVFETIAVMAVYTLFIEKKYHADM
ncbi:MAG: hypothetical protein MJ142_02950 [Clostridia bacterium]|nr:hypothetical protein [Clostridia bacterium]